MVSLISSVVFLIGIAPFHAAAGTVNLAHSHPWLPWKLIPGVRLTIQARCCWWDSVLRPRFSRFRPGFQTYPTAPAPVTAVFAGLLTKVGVYAIIRAIDPALSIQPAVGDPWGDRYSHHDRGFWAPWHSRTSYRCSLRSSPTSDTWFGESLSLMPGLGATIYYAVHHITVQTALLVVGLVERRGTTSLKL